MQKPPLWLRLTVQPMGRDMCVHIFGGKISSSADPLAVSATQAARCDTAYGPHVGAAALAQPCPSTTGVGNSASASVLSINGHKEDLLARALALRVARHLGVTVVVVCGIHADNATLEQMQDFETMAQGLVGDMLHHFDLSLKDSPCCA